MIKQVYTGLETSLIHHLFDEERMNYNWEEGELPLVTYYIRECYFLNKELEDQLLPIAQYFDENVNSLDGDLDPYLVSILNIRAFILLNEGSLLSFINPEIGIPPFAYSFLVSWLSGSYKVFTDNSELLNHFTPGVLDGSIELFFSNQKGIHSVNVEPIRIQHKLDGVELGTQYKQDLLGFNWRY